jgi:hypothetical protein
MDTITSLRICFKAGDSKLPRNNSTLGETHTENEPKPSVRTSKGDGMVMMAKVSLDDPTAALAKLCLKVEAAR